MTKKSRGSSYKNQAKKLLENSFPKLSCAAIKSVLDNVDFDFPQAFRLLTIISIAHPNEDEAKANAHEVAFSAKTRLFLKYDRPKKRFCPRDATLLAQIDAIPELNTKENNPLAPALVDDNNGEDVAEEFTLECGCCYGDYPPGEMKECSANVGHKVCVECIYRYVGEQLDGNGSVQFQCIVSDGCNHDYSYAMLDQVLSPKLKKRANDSIFYEQVKQAGIPVWTCPECAYLGLKPDCCSTIECPECKVFCCLTCNEKDHPNISCQEVAKEKARLANPTHRAHEAMTKAVTRLCPTCSKEYVKHDGCNKMTCTCKTKSCYLCGVKVDSYDHFCRHKKIGQLACHCGKTCELFTSTERMEAWDRKARYKAGKKVLKETGMDKKEIRRFLKRPEKKKAPPKKKKPHPVAQQQQQVPGSPPPPAAQPANAVPWEPLPGANVPDPLQVPIVLEPQVPGPPPPPAAQPENAVPQQPLPGANIPDPPLPIVPEQQVPDPPRPPRAAAANAVPQQPLPWEPLPGAKVDPDGCPIL